MSIPRGHPFSSCRSRAAEVLGLTSKAIRNLIIRGELTSYRVRVIHAVRVDLNEVRDLLQVMPATPRRNPFGPDARIVDVVVD